MRFVHSLLLLLAGVGMAAATTRTIAPSTVTFDHGAPTIVFLLRHAEKALSPPKDPPLTEAGAARATALAELLAEAGVTHLFASEFERTQKTVAPLATRLRKPVTVIAASNPDELAAQLRALPSGSVAVVAGHSNTIPALVRTLGGARDGVLDGTTQGNSGEQFPDDEYGRLIELVLEPAAAAARDAATPTVVRALRLHVGAR